MNLDEIGVFKNRVVSKLINDENVLDVLLGNTDAEGLFHQEDVPEC